MATSDVRHQIIQIVNEIQRRLGVNTTTTLTANKQTTVLLDLLNDVIIECSDFGDWQEMFREATVTASSSVGTYEVVVSANVKRIAEIAFNNDTAPLEVRDLEDMRRLQRISSYGNVRQFAIAGVSGVNMQFRCYPIPGSNQNNQTFDVWYYKQPRLMTTADVSAVPAFPSRVLTKGLYAKALLEENGGVPSPQYQVAYQEYIVSRREALNRFTHDTGTGLRLRPAG